MDVKVTVLQEHIDKKGRTVQSGTVLRFSEEQYVDWYFSTGNVISHDVEKAEVVR